MTITKHLALVTLLLPLAGCPDPDAVPTLDDDTSSGSGGETTTLGTLGDGTTSGASSGNASLDDTAGTSTGPEPTIPRATVIMQTSGGGRVSSPSFGARIRIGAPQPVGSAGSSIHHVHLGPGSAR
jgi:hypothetical protein